MTEHSDGQTGAVRDGRRPAFCYQTHDALDAIRLHFDGQKLATALAVYLCLTEAANRAGGDAARDGFTALRKDIAASCAVSLDTLDRYVKDLERAGVLVVKRADVPGVPKLSLPNVWTLVDPGPVQGVAAPVRPGGSRTGAAQEQKKENLLEEGGKPLAGGAPRPEALDPDVPPVIPKTEGQNLPLNALCQVTGVTESGGRIEQAVIALNGSRGKKGIRHYFWRELLDWAGDDPQRREQVAALHVEPERFAEALVRQIHRKAEMWQAKMPGASFAPHTLTDWWIDIEKMGEASARGGGVTAAEAERIAAAEFGR